LEVKSCLAGGRELSLKTESWGHEYSKRASVRVPTSQLRSDGRLGLDKLIMGRIHTFVGSS